jgi:hypothetical protein
LTLERATQEALAAAESSDLERLAEALDARAKALASGEPPTPEVLAAGERVAQLLRTLIQQTAFECARLQRMQPYLRQVENLPEHPAIRF